jgi:sulfatase maturation enzyme AslB (radical SAM superfamily)
LIAEGGTTMITKLYLMPTQKCNCSCTYCYIPHLERDKGTEYTFVEKAVKQFIEELKSSQLSDYHAEIRFIGGEPYLEFESMVQLTNLFLENIKNGKVVINSNGTLISSDKLNSLNNNCLERIIHIISLDGIESIHNKRRILKSRENAFRKTIDGIKLLMSKGFPVYFNMVLDEYTLGGINEFMQYLQKELKINELSVSLLYEPGKNNHKTDRFSLLKEVYKYAAENEILIGGHHRLLLGVEIPEFMCRAGEQTLLLSGDRKIYACQRFVGREEAEIFTSTHKFADINCSSCVNKNCYSNENILLGKQLHELYLSKYPEYLKVNEFDKILFGVL